MKAKWLVGMAAAILLLAPTAEAQRGGQGRSGRGDGGGSGMGRASQVSRGGDRGARPSRMERSSSRIAASTTGSSKPVASANRAPRVERSAPSHARVERAQPTSGRNVERANDRKGNSPLASGPGRGTRDRGPRATRTELTKPGGPTASIQSPTQNRLEKPGFSRPRNGSTERPIGSAIGRDPKVSKRPSVIEERVRPTAPSGPKGSTSADLSRTGALSKESSLNNAQANISTLRDRTRPGAESRTERKPDGNRLPSVLESDRRHGGRQTLGRDGDRRDGPGGADRNRLGRDGGRDPRLGRDGDGRRGDRSDFDRDRRGDRRDHDGRGRGRGGDWKGNDCDDNHKHHHKHHKNHYYSDCGPSWYWGDWCGWGGSGLSFSIGTSWSWGSLNYNYNSCWPYSGSYYRPYYYGSCYRPYWSTCFSGSWWCNPSFAWTWCRSPGAYYYYGPGYDWGVSDVGYSTTSPDYNYSWSSPSSRYGWVENNYSGVSTYTSQAGDSVDAFHQWQDSLNGDGEVTLEPPAGAATAADSGRKPDPDDRRIEPASALGASWEMLGDGRDEQALEFFAAAVERDSARASAQTGYGVASLLLGRMDAAEFALRRAVSTNALSLGFLPVDSRLAGRLNDASRGLRAGADTGNEWLMIGIVDYIRHDRAGAAEALKRAVELGESDPAARTLLEVVK